MSTSYGNLRNEPSGATFDSSGSFGISATVSGGVTPTLFGVSVTTANRDIDPAGTVTRDDSFSGTLDITNQSANETLDLLANGSLVLNDAVAGTNVALEATGLNFVSTCCHPIAGGLTASQNGESFDITFGPACAQATGPNGLPVVLPACNDVP